jgi:putative FmdB family regulatory protein
MPIYEYNCADCGITFEKLRPMSQADAHADCSQCGSAETSRAISLFSAISKSRHGGGNGGSRSISGAGGGCASCSSNSCATCSH